MDAKESDRGLKKQLTVETVRPPLAVAERTNGVAAPHKSRIREVSSRYMSTSINTASAAKRYPSPVSRSTTRLASMVVPKRAVSAERRRPSTPTLQSLPSTPVRDTVLSSATRKIAPNKQPESLWPSTMRSLSVSIQSDRCPSPTTKKERPVTLSISDRSRSFRLSSNAVLKQPESPPSSRKASPERKKNPLKGKSMLDQAENAKPADSSHAKLLDQHRWPSRIGGKISSGSLNRSIDLSDKIIRNSSAPLPKIGIPSLRRLSDGINKSIQKTSSDVSDQLPSPNILERKRSEGDLSRAINLLKLPELRKIPPLSSSDRNALSTPAVRSQSLPWSRHLSPIRTASQSKVSSPSHSYTRPSTPPRGLSPRIRPLGSSTQSTPSASVLSFITDLRNPKKSNQLEDAHQLRLLYNRCLQWRITNARTEVVLRIQKATAERSLNSVWRTNLALWDSVIKKKTRLQQMRLELKLNFILNEQLRHLEYWASLEMDHPLSLADIAKDLEGCTLRLPLIGGAWADIESLKVAMGSAMDVMQLMGPSIINLLSRAESMNILVSHLADLAFQERAMLEECESLLALNSAMQAEEKSLRTHLIQTYAGIDRC